MDEHTPHDHTGPTGVSPEAGPEARARDGVEHLQRAARELIQAARAMLDVVEEVVADPESLAPAAERLRDRLRHRGEPASGRPDGGDGDDPGGAEPGGQPANGLQRIPLD